MTHSERADFGDCCFNKSTCEGSGKFSPKNNKELDSDLFPNS